MVGYGYPNSYSRYAGASGYPQRPDAGGGIALVQSASGTTADGSAGLTVNFGVPVTVGNTALAFISYVGVGGVTLTTFSDPAAEVANGTAFTGLIYQWFANATPTGFTLTANAAVRASMTILEISGLANAAAEGTSTQVSVEAATSAAFNTVTPTSASNLIVGIAAFDANAYDSGPVAPFTRIGTGTGGASVWQEAIYAIQSSATPQDSNMTISGAFPAWATAAAAFGGA